MTRPLDTASVLTAYAPATKRLILFDYDGTLTPIVCNAADATLSTHQFRQLEKLASSSENAVWVISGRDQTFLKAQLGSLTKVGLVAEHGAFIRRPETEEWQELVIWADMGWQSIVQQVFEDFRSQHEGSFIEEKRVATVLHYRKVELQHLAEKDAIECKKSLEQALVWWPVNVIRGKCVLEARPAYTDKGQIVRRIFDELTHEIGYLPEFIFCVGDDVTDEDMFRALHTEDLASENVFTVIVSENDKTSDADYNFSDTSSVWKIIEQFNQSDAGSLPFLKLL